MDKEEIKAMLQQNMAITDEDFFNVLRFFELSLVDSPLIDLFYDFSIYSLKNSIDFTSPTVPVIMTSPPGAA